MKIYTYTFTEMTGAGFTYDKHSSFAIFQNYYSILCNIL